LKENTPKDCAFDKGRVVIMAGLGLTCLGAFIGYVITYALLQITDWSHPGNVLSSVISVAVAGAVFTFIQWLGGRSLGSALFMYPVGLAYGALCTNLRWVTLEQIGFNFASLHIVAFTIASLLLIALIVSPGFRQRLGRFDDDQSPSKFA
jgi:hypothetical protein